MIERPFYPLHRERSELERSREVVVTSYESPDLDGLACAYGYAELLRVQGRDARPAIIGRPIKETEYALQYFGIPYPEDGTAAVQAAQAIVLVDTNSPATLGIAIDHNRVTEVIDHHQLDDPSPPPNAAVDIQKIGAAATLVAERFKAASIEPSREIRGLLYTAIVSNTINFLGDVTTDRDRQIAVALRSTLDLPEHFERQFFQHKSELTSEELRFSLVHDAKLFEVDGHKINVAQLELANAASFVAGRYPEILDGLRTIAAQDVSDVTFLNAVDVLGVGNTFVALDENTENILRGLLSVDFRDGVARYPRILMRKQLVPKLREYLSQ